MRAILFLLTKGVRELHVNQIGNNFTALPKAVTRSVSGFLHFVLATNICFFDRPFSLARVITL